MRKAAIVIGVDQTGGLTPLVSAASGARRVAAWLKDEGFDVRCLTDADGGAVRRDDIRRELSVLVTNPPRYRLLVVYFSGHGYWQARSDLWLLSGAPVEADEAVNLDAAMDLAKYSGIPNIVFVSDACRSLPDARTAALIQGAALFPNYADIDRASKIDLFKATSEARPAYECGIDGEKQSVLTAAWLAAYREPEEWMVRLIQEDGESRAVVPNRRLENFLQRKVDRLLVSIEPPVQQRIEINVPSEDDVYIGRAKSWPPPQPAPTPPPLSSHPVATPVPWPAEIQKGSPDAMQEAEHAPRAIRALREAGKAVKATVSRIFRRPYPLPGQARPAPPEPKTVIDAPQPPQAWPTWGIDTESGPEVEARLPVSGIDHFETGTGFVLRGAEAADAVVFDTRQPLEVEILASHLLRVKRTDARFVPEHGDVASLALRLRDGRLVILAVLPGYIGHLKFDAQGLASLAYVPSSNHPQRWDAYASRREEIDRFRAQVALAADRNTFRVRSTEEAASLAADIRMLKAIDPALGLYAAHAFHQASDEARVRSVMRHMRDDLGADLFDVRLLARRRPDPADLETPRVPACPMLTQSWSLIDTREIPLSQTLRAERGLLCDSLWTTFAPEAAERIMAAIGKGELR